MGTPAAARVSKTTPWAWPKSKALLTLTLKKTSSTAAWSGRYLSTDFDQLLIQAEELAFDWIFAVGPNGPVIHERDPAAPLL